jgi:hypothetical protein
LHETQLRTHAGRAFTAPSGISRLLKFGLKSSVGASLLAKVLDFASPASRLLHTAF